MEPTKKSLLDPAFLRKLERLRIHARRAFPGTMRGERRSTRKGASVEFADFRKYEAGDDFRYVDWSIYARLERLMLRQFVEEEDVRIDILIDQSRSMHFGQPLTKFDFARRAAAALSFLAITSLDRAGVATFDSTIKARLRSMRGRGHLHSVLAFLDSLGDSEPDDSLSAGPQSDSSESYGSKKNAVAARTNLSAVIRAYQKASARPGILFIISDFLDPGDFRQDMKLLAHRAFDVNLIQVLSPEEMKPEAGGDLTLIDSETGEAREITVNERILAAYRAELARFTTSLESFSRSNGIGYALISADAMFEDLLFRNLIEARMAE